MATYRQRTMNVEEISNSTMSHDELVSWVKMLYKESGSNFSRCAGYLGVNPMVIYRAVENNTDPKPIRRKYNIKSSKRVRQCFEVDPANKALTDEIVNAYNIEPRELYKRMLDAIANEFPMYVCAGCGKLGAPGGDIGDVPDGWGEAAIMQAYSFDEDSEYELFCNECI